MTPLAFFSFGIIFTCCFASILCLVSAAVLDNYFIDCGAISSTAMNERKWVADSFATNVKFLPLGIAAMTQSVNSSAPYADIYRTARIFTTVANYSFKVSSPGHHWVRLHFYPFDFKDFTVNSSVFSVNAASLQLLSNLRVSDEITIRNPIQYSASDRLNFVYIMKEYLINAKSSDLVITFVPGSGSFAFINAIEMVSMPKGMFKSSLDLMGSSPKKIPLEINSHSLETMYRLNVGGKSIEPENDSVGMGRTWQEDGNYMYTVAGGTVIRNSSSVSYASVNESHIAPLKVYETAIVMSDNRVMDKKFNISWRFAVDSGFSYLVRFHFCEFEFSQANERVFRIYINNQIAAETFDVYAIAGGVNRAIHTDYISHMREGVDTMWVEIGPDTSTIATLTNPILNGLEIFKLSNKDSLAGSPRRTEEAGSPSEKNVGYKIFWFCIGAGGFAIIIAAIVGLCLFCRNFVNPHSRASNGTADSARRTDGGFTFAEIIAATNNFDESRVIGHGGFGKVYKGELEDGTVVAVKRANQQSEQGLTEFETEIELLSKVLHRHLVSLIGYCKDQNEMILVYEYMENGTLRSHLYESNLPPLSWKQRLEICIGAARGLHYLHTGAEPGFIHRDVKTTNILLDKNFVAKIADFGLSKRVPAGDQTHVSTDLKGTPGYLDPEYFRTGQLTEKSHVYSFGVVLFEVVCARRVIDNNLSDEKKNLAEWAKHCQQRGMLKQIIDPHLARSCSQDSLRKFGEIAERCLVHDGNNRPTIEYVLWNLTNVLQFESELIPDQVQQIDDSTRLQDQDRQVDESTLAQDEDQQIEESSLIQDQGQQIDESTFAQDQNRQIEESTLTQDQDRQIDESTLAQNQDRQIEESTLIQDQDRQMDESTLAQDQDSQIDESTLAQDQDQQIDESALAQDQDRQIDERKLGQDQDRQIDERTLGQDQDQQIEESTVIQDQDQQIDESTLAQDQDWQIDQSTLAEDQDQQIEESTLIQDQDQQIEESTLAQDQDRQIDESTLAQDQDRQIEESILGQDQDQQIDESTLAQDQDRQIDERTVVESEEPAGILSSSSLGNGFTNDLLVLGFLLKSLYPIRRRMGNGRLVIFLVLGFLYTVVYTIRRRR